VELVTVPYSTQSAELLIVAFITTIGTAITAVVCAVFMNANCVNTFVLTTLIVTDGMVRVEFVTVCTMLIISIPEVLYCKFNIGKVTLDKELITLMKVYSDPVIPVRIAGVLYVSVYIVSELFDID